METAREAMYTVSLQTPGGILRGKMRLKMDAYKASGILYWDPYKFPFSNVPVKNGEAVFQSRLKAPPVGFSVRVHLEREGEILQGTVITPFGSFPAYGRRMEENNNGNARLEAKNKNEADSRRHRKEEGKNK